MFLTPPTLIETSKLKTHPNNPRYIRKEKLESLKKSISEDPKLLTVRPLLVNPQMEVFAGNQRLRACIALEWEAIPCHVLDWTEEEQRRAMIKDNASSGEWDQDMLANDGWDAEELKEWGVPIDWEPPQPEGLTDPDDVPEVPEEPTTKPGDLWILGDHRLLCGDSTKAEDVERLMDGKEPDIVITDPPYGIDAISSSGRLSSRYEQYDNEEDDSCALSFINTCLDCGWDMIVFGGNYFAHALPKSTHWIIWDKRGADMKGGSANGHQSDCEIAWSNLKKKNVKIYKHVWAGWFREGNKKDELMTKVHPSQKPVGLFETIFSDYEFENFFDGFAGSGSTLIAAEKTGRKCYGMELDPKYCDVIVKRWEDFTGKKAELWKQ